VVQDPQPGVHVAGETSPPSTTTDYVLPSENLHIDDAAVFWPLSDDALFRLVGTFPVPELGPPARVGRRPDARQRKLSSCRFRSNSPHGAKP
jgi:hypothetical protein